MIRYLKRKWLTGRPLSDSLLRLLKNEVPVYKKLPVEYRELMQKRMKVLLNEKHFEGCGGLAMTDRKRVVISAYASVLILKETADYYGDLQSILVYPDDYVAPVFHHEEGGIISEGYEARKGEYWQSGVIVLSWQDIKNQVYGEERGSGQNLIYHEFSHLLDDRYSLTTGIDDSGNVLRDDEWTQIMSGAYRDLRYRTARSGRSVLDRYGATNPAEFFSVATELFFEQPGNLLHENTKLYNLLQNFYQLDPVKWR